MHHLINAGRHSRRAVLRKLTEPPHSKNLLVPGGAAIDITHCELDVRDTGELGHVRTPQEGNGHRQAGSAYCPRRAPWANGTHAQRAAVKRPIPPAERARARPSGAFAVVSRRVFRCSGQPGVPSNAREKSPAERPASFGWRCREPIHRPTFGERTR